MSRAQETRSFVAVSQKNAGIFRINSPNWCGWYNSKQKLNNKLHVFHSVYMAFDIEQHIEIVDKTYKFFHTSGIIVATQRKYKNSPNEKSIRRILWRTKETCCWMCRWRCADDQELPKHDSNLHSTYMGQGLNFWFLINQSKSDCIWNQTEFC